MKGRTFAFATLVTLGSLAGASSLFFYTLTGSFFPISRVEPLNHPIQVRSWRPDGLLLDDGRRVLPLGLTSLPTSSKALSEAVKRGVEVARDGHVMGQVKIFHKCGNDPVVNDLRRVDLAQFMRFMQGKEDRIGDRGWNSVGYPPFRK